MTAVYYVDTRTPLMWWFVATFCAVDAAAWIRVNGWPGGLGIALYATLACVGVWQARKAMRR